MSPEMNVCDRQWVVVAQWLDRATDYRVVSGSNRTLTLPLPQYMICT